MAQSVAARPPAHAGRFYPASQSALRDEVEGFIGAAPLRIGEPEPTGFVTPHAGYAYSGATAGHVYRQLQSLSPEIVFLFAPSHHASFPLASVWEGSGYATPLGEYPIDRRVVERLRDLLPQLGCVRKAHEPEHSLEVQIPFLQVACPGARAVPLLIGSQGRSNIESLVEGILKALESGERPGVAFVASSDGYHGRSVGECRSSDEVLSNDLRAMDVEALYRDNLAGRAMACGYGPVAAVMELSRRFGARRGAILHQAASADPETYRDGDYLVSYFAVMFD